jgi:protein-disulfide isomerase
MFPGLAALALLIGAALSVQGVWALLAARSAAVSEEQLLEIHTELRQIRQMLESEPGDEEDSTVPAVKTTQVSLAGHPALGSPTAPVAMVEFTDFQCPYCAGFQAATFPQIKKVYVDTNRVRYVTVDFPLVFHKQAFKAAEASHCADAQGQYWPLHDALFKPGANLDPQALVAQATGLGLNTEKFRACLEQDTFAEKVRLGIAKGRAIGVQGTPTFVIGKMEGGRVRGQIVLGAQPFSEFDAAIRAQLAGR